MNYELAKKLKDAGFFQRRGCSACLGGYAFDFSIDPTPIDEQIATEDKWVSRPCLEELIEACGVSFSELTKMTHDKEPQKWVAVSYSCEQCGKDKMHTEYGSTPSEAVANLWLELNNHDQTS